MGERRREEKAQRKPSTAALAPLEGRCNLQEKERVSKTQLPAKVERRKRSLIARRAERSGMQNGERAQEATRRDAPNVT